MKSLVYFGIGVMFAGAIVFGFTAMVVVQATIEGLRRLEK